MFSEEFKKKDLQDLAGKKKANVDHILVRDYVRKIDIGAFQSEYVLNKEYLSMSFWE